MAQINNLKIGKRLMIVFLIILLVTTFGFLYSLNSLNKIQKEVSQIYEVHLMSIDFLIESDRDAYQSSIALSHAMSQVVLADTEQYKAKIAEVWENYEQVNQRFTKFEELSFVPKQAENAITLNIYRTNFTALENNTRQVINLIESGKLLEAEKYYYGEYSTSFESMRDAMDIFTGLSLGKADESYKASGELSRNVYIDTIIVILVIIGFIILSAIVLTRSISMPLNRAVKYLKNIATGDLTQKITVTGKDEISMLMESMDSMTRKLNSIMENIKSGAEGMAVASHEISEQSQQISQGASEQASSAEEVSSSMEEMTANIDQNTDNSHETEQIAVQSSQGIEKVRKSSEESMILIRNIADKITIINDIAFQTNILALNAAVEAARAGEHGKGFAVVAAEVRKLAERSKIAADEIGVLSTTSVKATEQSTELLNQIIPQIEKTASLMKEIAAASIEQKTGASQINQAIQQLSKVTQQNAVSAEELASGSEEMLSQSEQLKEEVAYFRIDSDTEKEKHIIRSRGSKGKIAGISRERFNGDSGHLPAKSVNLKMDTQQEDKDFESF